MSSIERKLLEAAEVLRRNKRPSAQQRRRRHDIKIGERVAVKLGRNAGGPRGTVVDFFPPGSYGMAQAARVAWDPDGIVDVKHLTKLRG